MGKLIVIEGPDGSGKSTQIDLLQQRLDKEGVKYRKIKLPDYGSDSSILVRMYLNGDFGSRAEDVNAYAASAFFAVDRYASFKRDWGKDYESGVLIVADRYTTSNAYHQLEKLPKEEWDAFLEWLYDFEYVKLGIPKPDRVIYLNMPASVSQRLMTKRSETTGVNRDVHEADADYLVRCRLAADYSAKRCGWNIIDCARGEEPRSKDEINSEIFEIIKTI